MNFGELVQSADWKTEKHVPVIDAPEQVKLGERTVIQISVGKEIAHPNTTEHHIRWIKLYFKPEGSKFPTELGSFEFSAHGESVEGPNKGSVYCEPVAIAAVKLTAPGTLLAIAYCNIHGIWEATKTIKVLA